MKFKNLSKEKKKHVKTQIKAFEDRFSDIGPYVTDIEISSDFTLKQFRFYHGVFQSDLMFSVRFAEFIKDNSDLYSGKDIIDMFCGPGIQGITALKNGAKHVTFVDYSKNACLNTKDNLCTYDLQGPADVYKSDLFSIINKHADLIIANPPFFPSEPIKGEPYSAGMCISTEKLEEFYKQAHNYAPQILVCHWDFAGKENDPETLGSKYGWNLETKLVEPMGFGLQQKENSSFKIYLLEK